MPRSAARLMSQSTRWMTLVTRPDPYPTTLAEDGARHSDVGPRLGATRDDESDGLHSAAADADGSDEDGVARYGWLSGGG